MKNLYGIDYGAKLAGTTVVAYSEGSEVRFCASAKKQDADRFLLDFFAHRPPGKIFIDAPLSLPEVYRTGAENLQEGKVPDFHYRACDRELGAMSPMFLGGLTARAMKTAFHLRKAGHKVYETYPGMAARHFALPKIGYKGEKTAIEACLQSLSEKMPLTATVPSPPDWHHFDALLALCSAIRHCENRASEIGDEEGKIIF